MWKYRAELTVSSLTGAQESCQRALIALNQPLLSDSPNLTEPICLKLEAQFTLEFHNACLTLRKAN
jgi:hypothetical protein